MSIRHSVVVLCLLTMGFFCNTVTRDFSVPPRKAIRSAKNFAVQFTGVYNLNALDRYDLVIIDPDQSRNSESDSLSARKLLPVAYVNIGEAEEYRWYYPEIKSNWFLGKNPNWDRHYYLDANNDDWQNLLLGKILPKIFQKPYAGVFLDMIDIASPDLFPSSRVGVIRLIAKIREAYPDKIILMNNGTFLAESVCDLIDGICVESVFASYDFATKKYILRTQAEYENRAVELQRIRDRCKTRIFVIDYALPGDTATAKVVRNKSQYYGFVPFISTIELNAVDPYRQ